MDQLLRGRDEVGALGAGGVAVGCVAVGCVVVGMVVGRDADVLGAGVDGRVGRVVGAGRVVPVLAGGAGRGVPVLAGGVEWGAVGRGGVGCGGFQFQCDGSGRPVGLGRGGRGCGGGAASGVGVTVLAGGRPADPRPAVTRPGAATRGGGGAAGGVVTAAAGGAGAGATTDTERPRPAARSEGEEEPARLGAAGSGADGAGGVSAVGAAGAARGGVEGARDGGGGPAARKVAGVPVSVQAATSAPIPTTAVSDAAAALVRVPREDPGRCSSIPTDTAAQPKIASVASTTAHRCDTRIRLLYAAPPIIWRRSPHILHRAQRRPARRSGPVSPSVRLQQAAGGRVMRTQQRSVPRRRHRTARSLRRWVLIDVRDRSVGSPRKPGPVSALRRPPMAAPPPGGVLSR